MLHARQLLPLLLAGAVAAVAGCSAGDEPVAPASTGAARTAAAAGAADVAPYSAVPAPEWDALFDRESGWTGSDGIFAIPLSGDERPGGSDAAGTFFTFGDTFIGEVEPDGGRSPGSVLTRNTTAFLQGGAPDPAAVEFHWRTDQGGAPLPWIVPEDSRRWYWFQDGIVANGKLYDFAIRLRTAAFAGFAVEAVDLIAGSAAQRPLLATYTRTATPLFVGKSYRKGEVYFGAGLMPNTAAAGAPHPDGYLYVYGTQNDRRTKGLVVARVLPADLENFGAWRFWDGSQWRTRAADAVPVTDRVSSELSVTPLADGRYLLVVMLDALGRDVAVRYGDSPVGPWGEPIPVYRAPEPDLDPDVYTYNAKAHPHLSAPGELLISYNVNSLVFDDHLANADIYRPRFVRLPLP